MQQCKEQIKDLVKKYSDKHKDLHGSISKIGKVIDKVKTILYIKHFNKLTKCSDFEKIEFYSRFWQFTTAQHNRHKRKETLITSSHMRTLIPQWSHRRLRLLNKRS